MIAVRCRAVTEHLHMSGDRGQHHTEPLPLLKMLVSTADYHPACVSGYGRNLAPDLSFTHHPTLACTTTCRSTTQRAVQGTRRTSLSIPSTAFYLHSSIHHISA